MSAAVYVDPVGLPEVTAEHLAAIKSAVASVNDMLSSVSPDVRYDLRQELHQELAIKIIYGAEPATLRTSARNWLLSRFRDERNRRQIEAEYEAGTGRRYRTGSEWTPSWYPPHPDAEEFAPFAMRDARVMHCKTSAPFRDVQDAMAAYIDLRSAKK